MNQLMASVFGNAVKSKDTYAEIVEVRKSKQDGKQDGCDGENSV